MLYGTKPALYHLRVLGCLYFAKSVYESNKLKSRATVVVHMGYSYS